MNFSTQNIRATAGSQPNSVKQWAIGWTVAQATPVSAHRAGDGHTVTPGLYGLLAGAGRIVGSRR